MVVNETIYNVLDPLTNGAAGTIRVMVIGINYRRDNTMMRVLFLKMIKGKNQTVGAVIGKLSTLVVPKTPPPTPVVMEPLPLWQLASSGGYYVRLAGILGASAVALGAYGAHSTFPKDDKIELKEVFERANKYHFIHSLAMLGVPLCRCPKTSGTFFMLGIVMFSGTCYYLALTGDRSFNKITPVGGICFILGWLALAL